MLLNASDADEKLDAAAAKFKKSNESLDESNIHARVALEFCGDLLSYYNADVFAKFLEHINPEDKKEFVTKLYTRLKPDYQANLEAEEYLAQCMLFSLTNCECVQTVIDLVPDYIYNSTKKDLLRSLVTEQDWDRSKILKKIRFLPTEIALPISQKVLKLHYEEDPDDMRRNVGRNKDAIKRSGVKVEIDSDLDKQQKFFAEVALVYGPEKVSEVQQTIDLIDGFIDNPKSIDAYSSKYTESLSRILYHLQKVDPSSEKFNIYNEKMDKEREVPKFTSLLKDRIITYYKDTLLNTSGLDVDKAGADALDLLESSLQMYNRTIREVCPILTTVQNYAEIQMALTGIWFSGRDGIPMYLAVKADHWGKDLGLKNAYRHVIQPQIDQSSQLQETIMGLARKERESLGVPLPENGKENGELLSEGLDIYYATEAKIEDIVKMVAISRLVFDNVHNAPDKEIAKSQIRQYIVDLGITKNMIGIDTGFSGSVIKKVLALLDTQKEIKSIDYDDHVALINSNDDTITTLYKPAGREAEAYAIEQLPKKTDRTLAIIDGSPVIMPSKADMQHLSWVVDHAIMRNFAPRKPERAPTE